MRRAIFAALCALCALSASAITATKEYVDGRVRAITNSIAEVEADVATNAAEIAALSQSIDYSTSNTELVDTIETVAPQPGDYATVSNLAVHAVQTETDPTVPNWAKASSKPGYSYSEISGTPDLGQYATTGAVAQVSSSLADHASATNNPHHVTAAQIGALSTSGGEVTGELIVPGATFGVGYVHFTGSRPAYFSNGVYNLAFTSEIPTKVGDLTNDAGYITGYTEADPHAAGMASNVVTQAYIREKLGVYLYVGQDGGIYVHTGE